MENASKALIIAGAILISIVLITLGVIILGQGQQVVNNSSMDDKEITAFNSQFTQYEGENVSGGRVNSLIDAVIANNVVANRDGNTGKLITIVNGAGSTKNLGLTGDTTTGTTKVSPKAAPGKVYSVEVSKHSTAGYVSEITITAK